MTPTLEFYDRVLSEKELDQYRYRRHRPANRHHGAGSRRRQADDVLIYQGVIDIRGVRLRLSCAVDLIKK